MKRSVLLLANLASRTEKYLSTRVNPGTKLPRSRPTVGIDAQGPSVAPHATDSVPFPLESLSLHAAPDPKARSCAPRSRLCARACHSAIALTLTAPRTGSKTNPRRRVKALTHSAVDARSL